MSLEMWITYIFATTLILIIPGPTIILVVSQAVTHGRKAVVPLATGVVFGDFTAMTLSLLGLGAIMTASAGLFTIFKWIGALYLMFLGIKMWRAHPECSPIQHGKEKYFTRFAVQKFIHRDGTQPQRDRLFCGLFAPVHHPPGTRTQAVNSAGEGPS